MFYFSMQVIEAAKRGFYAEGIELNPWLVWYSRYKAWKEGVNRSTRFYRRDIFKADLSKYDHIIIFGVDSMVNYLNYNNWIGILFTHFKLIRVLSKLDLISSLKLRINV